MCPIDEFPDGNQGPAGEPPEWNSVSRDDVFFPEEPPDPPVEPAEQPPAIWDDMPAFEGEVYDGPPAKPKVWDSVGCDDVPVGRPEVVLPDFGPTINDAIAAGEAIKEMRAKIPEFEVLYDDALLDMIIRNAPGKG